MKKYGFAAVMLVCIAAVSLLLTNLYVKSTNTKAKAEGEKLTIVTSFYPMYIAAKNVIGDCEGVSLQNLSEPQTGCLHDFQLTPEDMKLLSTADVFIINGGGAESFLADVAEAYPKLEIIDTSEGVYEYGDDDAHDHAQHEHQHGENSHYWMSMPHYVQQVMVIAAHLSEVDAEHASAYEEHADHYVQQIASLQEEAADLQEALAGENVILFHEAYEFLAEDYGMNVVQLMDLDEERQVSAGEVADVVSAIEEQGVSLVLAEELYGKDMGDMVTAETGVTVIYLDTLVRGDYDPDSYLDGMRRNIELLRAYAGL